MTSPTPHPDPARPATPTESCGCGHDHPHTHEPPPLAPEETAAIEVREVSYAYPSGSGAPVQALKGVSLRVREGERLGIVGPNGGGKSTLLKLIMGLLSRQSGSVEVFGRSPARARAEGLVGYVAQRSTVEPAFPVSVAQAVAMPVSRRRPFWKPTPREDHDAARHALSLTGAEMLADRPIGALSGGQLQRVLIARAIAAGPRVLVLDEPTVGIDTTGQARFAEMISRLSDELGLTILIVSHDLRAVAAGCDRVACLARTLHYHDAPDGLTPEVLSEVFRHDIAPAVFASARPVGPAGEGSAEGGGA